MKPSKKLSKKKNSNVDKFLNSRKKKIATNSGVLTTQKRGGMGWLASLKGKKKKPERKQRKAGRSQTLDGSVPKLKPEKYVFNLKYKIQKCLIKHLEESKIEETSVIKEQKPQKSPAKDLRG